MHKGLSCIPQRFVKTFRCLWGWLCEWQTLKCFICKTFLKLFEERLMHKGLAAYLKGLESPSSNPLRKALHKRPGCIPQRFVKPPLKPFEERLMHIGLAAYLKGLESIPQRFEKIKKLNDRMAADFETNFLLHLY